MRTAFPDMTIEQANFVKKLRVKDEYTWRAVHREWQIAYEPKEEWWWNPAIPEHLRDKNIPNGHQEVGRELCYTAMDLLGEDVDCGWN